MNLLVKSVLKKALIITILFFAISLFISSASANQTKVLFFWGNQCPHCDKLKADIKTQGLDSLFEIEYLEIYNNEKNADLFYQKIQECEISPYSAGVPLIYIEGQCWMGSVDALEALKEKAGLDSITETTVNPNKTTSITDITEYNYNTDNINHTEYQKPSIITQIIQENELLYYLCGGGLIAVLCGIGFYLFKKIV